MRDLSRYYSRNKLRILRLAQLYEFHQTYGRTPTKDDLASNDIFRSVVTNVTKYDENNGSQLTRERGFQGTKSEKRLWANCRKRARSDAADAAHSGSRRSKRVRQGSKHLQSHKGSVLSGHEEEEVEEEEEEAEVNRSVTSQSSAWSLGIVSDEPVSVLQSEKAVYKRGLTSVVQAISAHQDTSAQYSIQFMDSDRSRDRLLSRIHGEEYFRWRRLPHRGAAVTMEDDPNLDFAFANVPLRPVQPFRSQMSEEELVRFLME